VIAQEHWDKSCKLQAKKNQANTGISGGGRRPALPICWAAAE
jgi:hypothetical protein